MSKTQEKAIKAALEIIKSVDVYPIYRAMNEKLKDSDNASAKIDNIMEETVYPIGKKLRESSEWLEAVLEDSNE